LNRRGHRSARISANEASAIVNEVLKIILKARR